jgi:hypothetical protein
MALRLCAMKKEDGFPHHRTKCNKQGRRKKEKVACGFVKFGDTIIPQHKIPNTGPHMA